MTGDEWLETVFTPCLARDSLAHGGDRDLLRGQLWALRDCGVLDAATCAEAEERLDAAVAAARAQSPFRIGPASRERPEPTITARLRRVIALGRPLALINGMPFLVTSVELWTNRTYVFCAGEPTAEADRDVERHHAEMAAWAQAQREHRTEGLLLPPELPGNRLFELGMRLRDDVGTDYLPGGGSAGGSGTEWRMQMSYEPAVPDAATALTFEVSDRDTGTVGTLEVPL